MAYLILAEEDKANIARFFIDIEVSEFLALEMRAGVLSKQCLHSALCELAEQYATDVCDEIDSYLFLWHRAELLYHDLYPMCGCSLWLYGINEDECAQEIFSSLIRDEVIFELEAGGYLESIEKAEEYWDILCEQGLFTTKKDVESVVHYLEELFRNSWHLLMAENHTFGTLH